MNKTGMEESLFRKKSLDRISSPEELGETLHVTSPAVWMILTAVILILAGMMIWSSTATVESFVTGTALVEDGNMRILFDDEALARNVEAGMTVRIGEVEGRIGSVGRDPDGALFATATAALTDGSYPASVVFNRIQVLRLLFN